MLFRLIIILSLSFSLILSGCSDKPITVDDITGIGDDIAEVFGKDDSENYGKSKSIAMLEIPPSLDDPDYSESLKVPKTIDARGEIIDMSDAPVLPSYLDMNIIKQGIARWLEVQATPSSLWPYLNQFWISQGFEIAINEPVNGILETKWKKNKINFESDGDLVESNDYNYNASKEKFRVRVERQPNSDTNIYISNHILEVDDVDDQGRIIWKKKESDVSREAEMLVRLMEYLGISRDVAIDSFNQSEKDNKRIFIDLIDFYGVPAILIEESFSKLWREIGLALDRSGLLVIDQNRNKAIYVINTNQITNKETDYEIKLTKKDEKYIITAHNMHRSKISYKDARRILKYIISSYGSDVVKK
jgi:outer membrane protein assembly factor BamC